MKRQETGKRARSAMEFLWDKGNINKSVDKHNVTPEQSEQALLNDPIELQEQFRNDEVRYFHLGETDTGVVLPLSVQNAMARCGSSLPAGHAAMNVHFT